MQALIFYNPTKPGYFVYGAPGYITHNINPKIKLSNGTPVQFHFLLYNDKKKQQDLEDKIKSTPISEVITMSTSPDAINVVVLPGDKEFEKSWKHGTLCEDGVVIPIIASSRYLKSYQMWISGGKGYGISRVTVKNSHYVEMG